MQKKKKTLTTFPPETIIESFLFLFGGSRLKHDKVVECLQIVKVPPRVLNFF